MNTTYLRYGFLGLLVAIGQSCSQGGGSVPTLSVGNICPLSNPLKPLPAQCCDGSGKQISFTGNCASHTPDDTSVNDALKAGSTAVAAARQAAGIAESLLGPGNQIAKGGAQIAAAVDGGIGSIGSFTNGSNAAKTSSAQTPGVGATSGSGTVSRNSYGTSTNAGSTETGLTTAGKDGSAGGADGSTTASGELSNSYSGKGGAGGGGTLSWFSKLGSSVGFGGGAGSGAASGDTANSMQFGASRGPASLLVMKSEDPADYFTRVGIQESLFKKVEKKYKDTAFSWARQDLPAKPVKASTNK